MTQDIWDSIWGDSFEEIVPVVSYNSIELARYFQDKFIGAPWNRGFGVVNVKALAGGIAKWKTRHDHATVTALIDKYMEPDTVRGKNPGWSDFLYRAEQLAAGLPSTGEKSKDKWDLLEEEWEREHGTT